MMKVFEIAKITLENTAHGESGGVMRWWWHILADFLVKVSKFCRSNGYFDMESSKLGRVCHHKYVAFWICCLNKVHWQFHKNYPPTSTLVILCKSRGLLKILVNCQNYI